MGFAMYGLAVVFAPAIGPTLGGYIVDHASWRWIFYINIPVGIASLILSSIMVEDPPWLEQEKEESRKVQVDWFSSPMIVGFAMATIISMVGTVIWEWVHPNPIVNVRLFMNRNFAASA